MDTQTAPLIQPELTPTLLGSSTLPAVIAVGAVGIQLGGLVAAAFSRFGAEAPEGQNTADAWNALEEDDREARLQAVLDDLIADPASVPDVIDPASVISDSPDASEAAAAKPEPKVETQQAKAEKATSKPKPEKPAKARGGAKSGAEAAHVVMKTSRMLGADGRSVARNRIARTDARRAAQLIEAGDARKATKEEIDAAGDAIAQLA